MEDKNERWLEVPDYPNYEVSNLGRVRSKKSDMVLLPRKLNSGYWTVGLFNKGKRKFFLVHRLVAMAFLPNPNGLPEVDHLDADIDNNCLENLRWVSAKENRQVRNKYNKYKKITTPIEQYDKDGNLIAVYDNQTVAAKETGIGRTMINRVLNDPTRHSTHGFIFKRVRVDDEGIK